MKRILLPALACFFVFRCAPTSERALVLPVDVRFANLYFNGYESASGIEALSGWPEDSLKRRMLLAEFEAIREKVKKEIGKYARRGGYSLVEQKELADVLLTLRFLPLSLQKGHLTLPVELLIKDLRSGTTKTSSFMGRAFSPEPSAGDGADFFRYYGLLFREARRTFPVDAMAELFYPHEEHGD
jgi:hypothetical protein